MKLKKSCFILIFCLMVFPVLSQKYRVLELAEGWAKTSINATIFRKNSVVSDGKFQYIAWYDTLGYVTLGKRSLKNDHWEIKQTNLKGNVYDAHNSISIMVDGDGYLHLAWDHHDGPLNYCRSKRPGALDLTNKLQMVGSFEDQGVTYPEFYRLPNGDLLFAYRHGASGKGNLVLNRYYTKEKTWRRIQNSLIDGEGERNPYWQMCVDKSGVIHISWVWRESWDIFTNHDLCYAKSYDGGENWVTSRDEPLVIPITASTAEYAMKIPQGSNLINQTSIYADSKGQPFIATYWTQSGDTVPQFYLVYLKDRQWNVSQVTKRQMPFSLKGGGTRRIPVSRPQVILSEKKNRVYVIYRDREQNNNICISSAPLRNLNNWSLTTISGFDVGQWEPSYDTELWKGKEKLHLFVQKVGQGKGNEKPENLTAQLVKLFIFKKL